jgi:hypothetical protein
MLLVLYYVQLRMVQQLMELSGKEAMTQLNATDPLSAAAQVRCAISVSQLRLAASAGHFMHAMAQCALICSGTVVYVPGAVPSRLLLKCGRLAEC